jgi:hypothetical protein
MQVKSGTELAISFPEALTGSKVFVENYSKGKITDVKTASGKSITYHCRFYRYVGKLVRLPVVPRRSATLSVTAEL